MTRATVTTLTVLRTNTTLHICMPIEKCACCPVEVPSSELTAVHGISGGVCWDCIELMRQADA